MTSWRSPGSGSRRFALPSFDLLGYHFQVTRFMVMEVVAAVLVAIDRDSAGAPRGAATG